VLAPLVVMLAFAHPPAGEPPQPRRFHMGIGASVGDPTGFSLKGFFVRHHALQLEVGWGPLHRLRGVTHLTYLGHIPFAKRKRAEVGLALGVGIGLGFWGFQGPGYEYGDAPPDERCDADPTPEAPDDCYNAHPSMAVLARVAAGFYVHWQRRPFDTVLEGAWSPFVAPLDLPLGDVSLKVRWYFF
jgi:hypothetical protein